MTATTANTDPSAYQPADLDEALAAMDATLRRFHKEQDKRAIFLRLYYIMTREVEAAVKGLGDYETTRIFLDPGWIRRLSGIFSSMYFASLRPSRNGQPESRAWKVAHETAGQKGSTATENALLGIVAHITYDLPRAIAQNLAEHDDLADESMLRRRKFDHDQVNNLLVRCIDTIQNVLDEDYEPGVAWIDRLLGRFDERLSGIELKHYRERVWWDALTYAAAVEHGDDSVVRNKLDWESYKIARTLVSGSVLQGAVWGPERVVGFLARLGRGRRFGRDDLEPAGGVRPPAGLPLNPFR